MAVKITDTCICCDACLDECPVDAIVDDSDTPNDDEIYYVYSDKCVECVDHNEEPACAAACPTEGCIVWSEVDEGCPAHPDRGEIGEPVEE